jgi:hypothetical protein
MIPKVKPKKRIPRTLRLVPTGKTFEFRDAGWQVVCAACMEQVTEEGRWSRSVCDSCKGTVHRHCLNNEVNYWDSDPNGEDKRTWRTCNDCAYHVD